MSSFTSTSHRPLRPSEADTHTHVYIYKYIIWRVWLVRYNKEANDGGSQMLGFDSLFFRTCGLVVDSHLTPPSLVARDTNAHIGLFCVSFPFCYFSPPRSPTHARFPFLFFGLSSFQFCRSITISAPQTSPSLPSPTLVLPDATLRPRALHSLTLASVSSSSRRVVHDSHTPDPFLPPPSEHTHAVLCKQQHIPQMKRTEGTRQESFVFRFSLGQPLFLSSLCSHLACFCNHPLFLPSDEPEAIPQL